MSDTPEAILEKEVDAMNIPMKVIIIHPQLIFIHISPRSNLAGNDWPLGYLVHTVNVTGETLVLSKIFLGLCW